jgi:hypothetical protein
MAVASRRWVLFCYGFLLLSGIDAVAMYLHLSGELNTLSFWVVEAMIAPFAVLSIPITRWCVRHWPSALEPSLSAVAMSEPGGRLIGATNLSSQRPLV